jgi:NADPH:quinone reductase-like Zn-dependent oxidoreductase
LCARQVRACKGKVTVKAGYIDRHGPPEALTYGDMRDPVAGPRQIVVDLHAVNGVD